MKALLAVAALVAVAGAASLSQEDPEFYTWKLKFGKNYSSAEEESRRKSTWLESRKLVLEHNLLADQGLKSYRLGMNEFADMDDQEYQDMFSGCLRTFNTSEIHSATAFFQPEGGAALPANVDWRKKGYVTAVKSQKNCGSCWAFSATGALEGQVFRKKKKLISLSEQQLVDCSFKFGNTGCNGGWPTAAFKYVKSIGGLQSEGSYPYKAKNGKCKFNKKKVVATCRGHKSVANGNERVLQTVLASVGPISVAIDASRHTFKLYKSGVYDDPKCSKSKLGHAVLVVGYGRFKEDYWLVKNSWGVNWGDKGYIKMSRNKKNQCGIASEAVYPIV